MYYIIIKDCVVSLHSYSKTSVLCCYLLVYSLVTLHDAIYIFHRLLTQSSTLLTLVCRHWSFQGPCPLVILIATLLSNVAYQEILDD
jgi:hypothetical protein